MFVESDLLIEELDEALIVSTLSRKPLTTSWVSSRLSRRLSSGGKKR